jgi:hypothetical protein
MTDYATRKRLEAALRERAGRARTGHPLSYAQRPLLILHRMDPDSASYNVGFTARFTGGFDSSALHGAVRSLTGRHAALRTTFGRTGADGAGNGDAAAADGGGQTVHGWLEPGFAEVDASGWGEQRLDEAVRAAYREPFDLAAGPLIRVRVFLVAPGEAVVLLTLHHVVCDFWSLGVVVEELEELYRAETEQRPARLPGDNVPYSDFVAYQRELLAGERGARARAYWHAQLAEAPEPARWPRFELDPADGEGGGSLLFPFPAEVVDQVLALARTEQVTPYAVLLTAFQVLLGRYTGRRDVLVGTPVAGRTGPGMAGCVGNFVNPVVLRAALEDEVSFREQLGRTRRTVAEALEHQDHPFELLVAELAPRRVDDRNPLFQAMFSYQKPSRYPALAGLYVADEGAAPVAWGGLTAVPYRLDQQDDQLELVLEVVHDGDRLVGLLKYRRSVFSPRAAREVSGNYLTLLRAALADPELAVGRLSPLARIEAGAGREAAPADRTGGARHGEPDAAALRAFERRVTDVWQEVLGVARERIGPHDNFFDLGGTSMLVVAAHERLADAAADRPLKVPELFRYPTVASLARRLAQSAAAPGAQDAGRTRASSRRVQLADGTARSARLRARERRRPAAEGGKDV